MGKVSFFLRVVLRDIWTEVVMQEHWHLLDAAK
jgi:hypothetical protein